jgi:hypothetical protein
MKKKAKKKAKTDVTLKVFGSMNDVLLASAGKRKSPPAPPKKK